MKTRLNRGGYTLMELVIAITLAQVVATLIFMVYTGMFRGVHTQEQNADRIRTMVQVKHSMDNALKNVEVITMLSPRLLTYTERNNRADRSISFHDSTIYLDNTVLHSNVREVIFNGKSDDVNKGRRLVSWEVQLDNGGWVGGAFTAAW